MCDKFLQIPTSDKDFNLVNFNDISYIMPVQSDVYVTGVVMKSGQKFFTTKTVQEIVDLVRQTFGTV